MKQKFICLFLSFVLCFGVLAVSSSAAGARDTCREEALAADLKSLGLFKGVSDTDFDLNRAPSRIEALVMLIRVLGEENDAVSGVWTHPFTDVPQWADRYIGYAYQAGLTNGVSATQFGVGEATAATYLTFMLRALGYSDAENADFSWADPFTLAGRVGILPGCVDTKSFLRADVVTVSCAALSAKLKDASQTLADKLISAGVFSQTSYDALYVRDKLAALPSEPAEAEPSYLEAHFIDVGQGDASLILCDGHAMLIDGGAPDASRRIYSYLQSHGITDLDYIVCTHDDSDHSGGLSAALNYSVASAALAPIASSGSSAFSDFTRYLAKQGVSVTVPSVGSTFPLGSASVRVLGPVRTAGDDNNNSLILQITYGATSFLFTGDAEREEEQDLLDSGRNLKSTVLKVSHHGSSDASSYLFLRSVAPQYAVISVGAGNPYGHPTETVLSRLRDAEVKTYRTDMQGTVICRSDGKSVSFEVEKAPDADTLSGDVFYLPSGSGSGNDSDKSDVVKSIDTAADYILNINTGRFHSPLCRSVAQIKSANRREFHGSRQELIRSGYIPCGNCKP